MSSIGRGYSQIEAKRSRRRARLMKPTLPSSLLGAPRGPAASAPPWGSETCKVSGPAQTRGSELSLERDHPCPEHPSLGRLAANPARAARGALPKATRSRIASAHAHTRAHLCPWLQAAKELLTAPAPRGSSGLGGGTDTAETPPYPRGAPALGESGTSPLSSPTPPERPTVPAEDGDTGLAGVSGPPSAGPGAGGVAAVRQPRVQGERQSPRR